MGCILSIIGFLVVGLGIFYFALASSFSKKEEMTTGIVLIVVGVILYFFGLTFNIFTKDKIMAIWRNLKKKYSGNKENK